MKRNEKRNLESEGKMDRVVFEQKSNARSGNDKKTKTLDEKKNDSVISNEFPNFAALTQEEKLKFYEALSTARKNVEKSGGLARERFGTVHDEYLQYFNNESTPPTKEDIEQAASATSFTTQATYSLGSPPEGIKDCGSMASLPEEVRSEDLFLINKSYQFESLISISEEFLGEKKIGSLNETEIANSDQKELNLEPHVVGYEPYQVKPFDMNTWSEYEKVLLKDQDKIVDLFLKKKRVEDEKNRMQEGESEEIAALTPNDSSRWFNSKIDTTSAWSKILPKNKNKENIQPGNSFGGEILTENSNLQLPNSTKQTPKFDALNVEEKEIFFNILKDAHDNILKKNPQKKSEIASFESILKRYLPQNDAVVAYSTSIQEFHREQLNKKGKNVKVKLTLTSADNRRLLMPERKDEGPYTDEEKMEEEILENKYENDWVKFAEEDNKKVAIDDKISIGDIIKSEDWYKADEKKDKNMEESKSEVSKSEVSKSEVTKSEVSKSEVSKSEVSKSELPKNEISKSEVPKSELSRNKISKSEVSKKEVSKSEVSKKKLSKNEIARKKSSRSEIFKRDGSRSFRAKSEEALTACDSDSSTPDEDDSKRKIMTDSKMSSSKTHESSKRHHKADKKSEIEKKGPGSSHRAGSRMKPDASSEALFGSETNVKKGFRKKDKTKKGDASEEKKIKMSEKPVDVDKEYNRNFKEIERKKSSTNQGDSAEDEESKRRDRKIRDEKMKKKQNSEKSDIVDRGSPEKKSKRKETVKIEANSAIIDKRESGGKEFDINPKISHESNFEKNDDANEEKQKKSKYQNYADREEKEFDVKYMSSETPINILSREGSFKNNKKYTSDQSTDKSSVSEKSSDVDDEENNDDDDDDDDDEDDDDSGDQKKLDVVLSKLKSSEKNLIPGAKSVEDNVQQVFDIVPSTNTGKIVVVDDSVIFKITQLIQDLEKKVKCEESAFGNEYIQLLLNYIDYLSKVLHYLIKSQKKKNSEKKIPRHSKSRINPVLTSPVDFQESIKSITPERSQKHGKSFISLPISSIEMSSRSRFPLSDVSQRAKEKSEKTLNEEMESRSSESGSGMSFLNAGQKKAEDNSLLMPMFTKIKKQPTTNIRILQDLLKERATFVEGSITEFKIVQVPNTVIESPDYSTGRLHFEDIEDLRTEKVAKTTFLKILARICRCGKKEVVDDDNVLENLKGEAVAVDVSSGTRNPASVTLNDSTMEVLKAAERKKIIEKYWKSN